jgi:hypothetical protein
MNFSGILLVDTFGLYICGTEKSKVPPNQIWLLQCYPIDLSTLKYQQAAVFK